MRFRILLEVNRKAFGNTIPINYQYEQSAAIYRILSKADKGYADWLHNNGFKLENGKNFKLFSFSRFKIEKRQVQAQDERIRILCDSVEWQISFLPEKSTEKFIQGLFANQIFEIGDKKSVVQFQVREVQVLPSPEFTTEMLFATMSPMCLREKREDGSTRYLSPTDALAPKAILSGLMSRYESFYGKPYTEALNFDFTALNVPKSVLVKIKSGTKEQTKVRGYMCQFRIKAPIELIKIMYESGIGEECSQGFGYVKSIKSPQPENLES